LDVAESPDDHALPYEGLDEAIVMSDLRIASEFLSRSITSRQGLRTYLLATDPFRRYPALVERVLQEG
jgi:hypothetical protein